MATAETTMLTMCCVVHILLMSSLGFVVSNSEAYYGYSSNMKNKPLLFLNGQHTFKEDFNRPNDEVPAEPIHGIYLHDVSKTIASHLRHTSNDELGVTNMQEIYDALPFASLQRNDLRRVQEIASKLQLKMQKYMDILNTSMQAVQDLYYYHAQRPVASVLLCSNISDVHFVYDPHFGTKVATEYVCDTVSPVTNPVSFHPGQNLTSVFSVNFQMLPTMKWQYFMSPDGVHSEYPAHLYDSRFSFGGDEDSRHRDIYVAAIETYKRNVVVVVDQGNSLSASQVHISKAIAKHIINTLSPSDRVGLLSLAGEPTFPGSDECLSQKMAYATHETKFRFSRFIDGLAKEKVPANHSLGLQSAFRMIRNTLTDSTEIPEVLVVYISRGLLSSLTEAKTVLETLAFELNQTHASVTINTYAVIDESKPVMYEKYFLRDLAEQNYQTFNVSAPMNRIPGSMTAVNSTKNLSVSVGKFYEVFNNTVKHKPTLSLPYWDPVGKGLVVSLAAACIVNDIVLGIVGMDLHLEDITEDITYFNQYGDTYAFLLDKSGYALMHPSFPRPVTSVDQPMHTHIAHLETWPGFTVIQQAMLTQSSGNGTLTLQENATNSRIEYSWQWVDGSDYIVCVVSKLSRQDVQGLKRITMSPSVGFLFHKLDVLARHSKVKICRHFQQMATTDVSTIFFAPGCFSSPFEYLSHDDLSLVQIQSYMAYLVDSTKLLANPGLKPGLRSDAAAIIQMGPKWKLQLQESKLSRYIIRRYIATPSGIFLSYPGMVLDRSYDPTRQSWYLRALAHPGRVVLTAPYLDAGGAGYVVTLSHTVYEGKSAALHSNSDTVVAVMGMDFTFGYLYKILRDVMPFCEEDNVKCFLMDEGGYLVTHPDLVDSAGKGPSEQLHLTHREPLLANDILNHGTLVRKKLCNSFVDRTMQRSYQFNLTMTGVLTNLVHGEHCSKYQVTPVPGSNVFIAVVNETCVSATAFCPCSMVDRLCLNCHRMEQSECECPCECPLEVNLCTGDLLDDEDNVENCAPFPEQNILKYPDPGLVEGLPVCVPISCSALATKNECFAVMGCSWCTLESDGETEISSPYCTSQNKCFGGVLNARTPYEAMTRDSSLPDEYVTYKSTPVGPVAGGVMCVFLLLALMVYCYRHHHRGSHGYSSSMQESAVRMSQLNNEIDEGDSREDLATVPNNITHQIDAPLPISPYRVNTNYRRPPGGDSDHGYSTMTPHEDSEHIPYFEPLLFGKDKPKPGRSVTSSSRTSSPLPSSQSSAQQQPLLATPETEGGGDGQTVLPEEGRHILAPVTVHMVDVN